jgi:hypothetical protein
LFQDIFFWILEILRPAASIERAVEFNVEKYKKNIDSFGDHQEWMDENRDPAKKKPESTLKK